MTADDDTGLRSQSFLILSRLQSGTEEVVRLDSALAAIAQAVAMERKACAKVAMTCDVGPCPSLPEQRQLTAEAIRSRGKESGNDV